MSERIYFDKIISSKPVKHEPNELGRVYKVPKHWDGMQLHIVFVADMEEAYDAACDIGRRCGLSVNPYSHILPWGHHALICVEPERANKLSVGDYVIHIDYWVDPASEPPAGYVAAIDDDHIHCAHKEHVWGPKYKPKTKVTMEERNENGEKDGAGNGL